MGSRGFEVKFILVDPEFSCLMDDIRSFRCSLNITATNKHVPEVERAIRTIKERVRSYLHVLPFKKCLFNIFCR